MGVFSKIFLFLSNLINYRGIDYFNDLFKPTWKNADVISERVKAILLFMGGVSIIMMVSDPDGALYSTFLMPISANILLLHRIPFPPNPTPESGMHWSTILTYTFFAYNAIRNMERDKIDKPFHKLIIVFMVFAISLYVPFEFVYITLYDLFHNIPVFGYPAIWAFGWWKSGIALITQTVIGSDVLYTLLCIVVFYLIYMDLKDFFPVKLNFDKKAKVLLGLYLITTLSWVLIPLHTDVVGYGTKWFPQTIYVKYDYYANYPDTLYNTIEPYGIVEEYWNPNIMIKIHNVVSKVFACAFTFHWLIPSRKKEFTEWG